MVCFPNCKINLGLYVTNKRNDGYHDLETVFYPLSPATTGDQYMQLRDVLEVVPAQETKMHLSGLPVAGNPEGNLVWKAYELLRQDFPGKIPAFDIYLHKVIPMGAGLGGGSADGSFMLRLLNDYCSLGLSAGQLAAYALQLGSDCPIFIHNTPMFAMGRGEQLTPSAVDLSAYSIQLVCPHVHVSTGAAFSKLTPRPSPLNLRNLATMPLTEWKDVVGNDFERSVFAQHPVLAAVKQQLYDQGAIYASMSGTGSTVYGIFPKSGKGDITVEVLSDEFYIA
jgi:4-diphosphocytidyl-2-C-methyl-D-erythritol kinase